MTFFLIIRAVFVRALFACHGMASIWHLYMVTGIKGFWSLCLALLGLLMETFATIHFHKGKEYKWLSPSVFFYLLSTVPAIWCLELFELDKRIKEGGDDNSSFFGIERAPNVTGLEATIGDIPVKIPINLTSEQWLTVLEQFLLLLLIIGRWILPKGKLTRDQLSQLLLVYIGTAADIVEFFEAFKEETVKYNRLLCCMILGIWSWSLLQFTIVLTATKARKDHCGIVVRPSRFELKSEVFDRCCTPDVYGIIISIMMQDLPFLVLRLMLIIHYQVRSYSNFFFTCKNTLVILLLIYRLIVIQIERRRQRLEQSSSVNLQHEKSQLPERENSSFIQMASPLIKRTPSIERTIAVCEELEREMKELADQCKM